MTIDLVLDRDVPLVEADRGQIQQVVMNLLLNAAEAVGDEPGGSVFVRAGGAEISASNAPVDAASGEALPPGRYVLIEVRDTGCGMEQETRAKIFDPFFTTKFMGRGLGLAAVAGVVKAHGGGIQVESAVGAGTTFRVFLPAAGRSGRDEAGTGPDEARGARTVLVVDDEKTVRDFVRAALEKFGYRVLTAANGREAVRLVEQDPGAADAVLLDLRMPVLGGEDAIDALRAARPDVKVVLMSGYGEMEAARLYNGKGVAAFLQKPFTASRLAEQVKAVLSER
jgi:CheY-like chemotaxis protein